MGICSLGDIFQYKVDKLLGDIDGVKTYTDDILVFSKYSFEKHIDKPRIIFGSLHATGLKVNAPKCSFWLNEIPYLGYVITSEGIKPDLKKVQWVMYLDQPSTTTESLVLICMVKYYMNMWPRRSHILDPLTEGASVPKGGKIFWNDTI